MNEGSYVEDDALDDDPSGLQTACVASAGKREGFVRMSVVLLKFRNELNTAIDKKCCSLESYHR